MPLDEKDMDNLLTIQTVDTKYSEFLSKMEKGKYYSQSEMATLILGKPLAINETLIDLERINFKLKLERFGNSIKRYFFCELFA
jgi:hypothetical protein